MFACSFLTARVTFSLSADDQFSWRTSGSRSIIIIVVCFDGNYLLPNRIFWYGHIARAKALQRFLNNNERKSGATVNDVKSQSRGEWNYDSRNNRQIIIPIFYLSIIDVIKSYSKHINILNTDLRVSQHSEAEYFKWFYLQKYICIIDWLQAVRWLCVKFIMRNTILMPEILSVCQSRLRLTKISK